MKKLTILTEKSEIFITKLVSCVKQCEMSFSGKEALNKVVNKKI